MSMCTGVTVYQDTTTYFSNVVATIAEDASIIWITLGESGEQVTPPQAGEKYAIQGDAACINTYGTYLGSSTQGWEFQNLV